MLINDVDKNTGFIMIQIIPQWSVIMAQIFTYVTGATCLLVKSEKYQFKKLLLLEAKDISFQALAPSNVYGVTTLESHTII